MSEAREAFADEVIEVERRWVQAHRELDLDAIEEILADDYLQIRADGSVFGKKEALQSYRSGNRRWDYAESDQYQVGLHGDVAILIGRWRGQGKNAGERFDYTARFLAVYVKQEGVWRLIADQSTPLSE
jgi:ketosteroid isomerase-like protein